MSKQPYSGLRGGPEEVTLNFRFQINGTSDPDFFFGSGGLVSDIVRDGIGAFTVTLDKNYRYQDVIVCHASVAGDLTDDAQYVSWTQATGALVVNTILQDGTQAVDDPADDSWVHVSVTFCRRTALAQLQAI
jgi:hypothetical protein